MAFKPIPKQVSPEHLDSLSTPELVAERIRQHEQYPGLVEEANEAQTHFHLISIRAEDPARESVMDRLGKAQSACNIILRDILVTDEALRYRDDDTSWLRDRMYEVLRRSDRNRYYEEEDEDGPSYQRDILELKVTVSSFINEDAA
jgi:hypothetical protein